ncbi:MAG: ABC transporter permease [Gemmatimonadetes bacterium]|nr:ABC transporter permease [Gemmatimonadota bacterium]
MNEAPAFRALQRAGVILALLATALALLVVLLVSSGHAVGPALAALGRGAAGSTDAVLSATLVRATPLLITGLAITLAFRAGVINVGAEGQLLVGAAAATAVALKWPTPGLIAVAMALAVGAVAGGAWAAVAAVLRRRFGVLEVISTLMLNFIAQYLLGWLVRGPMQEPTRIYPQSSTLAPATHLPLLVAGSRLHAGFALALVLTAVLALYLARSAAGFRVRVVGANAAAALSAGRVDAAAVAFKAFVLSGVLAGLAGGVEVTGVSFALYENLSPGYGFSAIAVALLARIEPVGVIGTALLFGALEAGAVAMQRDAGVPSVVVNVVEAVLILLVVAVDRWRARQVAAQAGA